MDRPRGGGLIDDLLLVLLVLVGRHLLVGVPYIAVRPNVKERLDERPAARVELHLLHAALQPLAAAFQGLIDRLRARRQPPLQPGEGEPDRTFPLVVLDPVGLVHLLPDVLGDLLIEGGLCIGERVRDRLRDPLWEEGCPVEFQEVLLHHPAHQVGNVHFVGAIPELSIEPVRIQQGEEELEVLLLAVVRRRRHQEQVPGMGAEQFSKPEPLRPVHLRAVVRRRHLVCLVHHHEIPLRVREFLLQFLVPGELIEPGDQQGMVVERVAGERLLREVAGEDGERKAELLVHLVLPLLDETPGGDDQNTFGICPHQELADQQAGHDRLAGAGIVCQDEPQRLPGEHRLVDCRDLVGERLDVRSMDRHHRVEEVGQVDPVGFRSEFERLAGRVERPRPPGLREGEGGLVGTKEHLLLELPVGSFVVDRQRVLAHRIG